MKSGVGDEGPTALARDGVREEIREALNAFVRKRITARVVPTMDRG